MATDAGLIEADANNQYSATQRDRDPTRVAAESAPRPVREYLDVLDEAGFGAASNVKPKVTSFPAPVSQCISGNCCAMPCR